MTQDLIDTATFTELSDAMGADFVTELVNTFLDDAPNMIADLKQGASDGEADVYRRAAHSIKSNAELFGALPLTQRAREMELSGLPSSDDPISELEAVFAATAESLRGLLDD